MVKAKLRVGVYVRVSKEDQHTANQKHELLAVAAQRNWEVVEVYEDHGVSGAKSRDKRPAFQKMATDAAKGRINMVAAWSVDRLGRTSRDVINFMADLPDQGVALYLHREQLDTSTPVGKLVFTIMAAISEMERERLIERIHSGLARARREGKHLGRKFTVTEKTKKRIRKLSTSGVGRLKIARKLGVGVGTVVRTLGPAPAKAAKAA